MNVLEQSLNAADLSVLQLEIFFLIIIRCSFIVFLLPFINNPNFPNQLKVGLSFFLALIIYPQLKDTHIEITPGTGTLFALVIKECLVGMLIGFVGQFLFAFVEFGAEIINREIGLSMMPIMNPASGEDSTDMTQMITMIFSIMFLASGYHFFFIEILYKSFGDIPLGGFVPDGRLFAITAITLVSESIVYGFRFAMPIFSVMIVTAIAMGFMSRVMPQMNVWIISVPIKIMIGVVTLVYSLPLMYRLFQIVFDRTDTYLRGLIHLAGKAAV